MYFRKNLKIDQVKLINQDNYFWPIDWPKHEWIKDLNHINREQLSALDMDKMCEDLITIIGNGNVYVKETNRQNELVVLNILIIEGFLIFNHTLTAELCQVKICIDISFEQCFDRRKQRVYKQPTPPGYVERYLWPLYGKHFDEYKNMERLHVINGGDSKKLCTDKALAVIKSYLSTI